LIDIVAYLKEPERYTKLGARLPKGVLLVGSPGIGKCRCFFRVRIPFFLN
ncbi:unnamed protein product, partial [Rotaria sp. Silwood1]